MPAGAIPFPFGNCLVCADKATGVHYGVATCEGCKGFFKRSIPKADKYKCLSEGQCVLNPLERNRCKSCRFRRCLDVGMSIDGVKMGRIPKVEKERALELHRRGLDVQSSMQVINQERSLPSTSGIYQNLNGQWQVQTDHLPDNGESKDKVSNSNRCSSSDSGIDDEPNGLRDVSKSQWNAVYDFAFTSDKNHYLADSSDVLYFGQDNKAVNHARGSEALSYSANIVNRSDIVSCKASTLCNTKDYVDSSHLPSDEVERFEYTYSCLDENPCLMDSIDERQNRNMMPSLLRLSLAGIDGDGNIGGNVDGNKISLLPSCIPVGTSSYAARISPPAPSSSSSSSHSGLPFYPTVIRELLSQVIETGHTREFQQNLVKLFLSSDEPKSSEFESKPWMKHLTEAFTQRSVSIADGLSQSLCYSPTLNMTTLKRKVEDGAGHESFDVNRESSSKRERMVEDEEGATENIDLVVKMKNVTSSSFFKNDKILENKILNVHKTFEGEVESGSGRELQAGEQVAESEVVMIPGLELDELPADQRQRVTKMKMMANAVPKLTFWDIPENTLTSSVDQQLVHDLEMEQRQKELNCVVDWLEVVGQRFSEKMRMDTAMWESESQGLRPVHPMNLMISLSQKDINTFWNEVVACIPICNFLVLGLCSTIPGFNQLDQGDRAILMEAAYFDLWLILFSSLFRNGDCYLRLVSEARFSKFWMQIFMPERLIEGMFHFADELNSCLLTPTELIILCAIQLTSKEHNKLSNRKRIQQLHDYYLDLLAYHIERTKKSNHSRILIKIFQLLPTLSPIGREQLELTNMMLTNQPPEFPEKSAQQEEWH